MIKASYLATRLLRALAEVQVKKNYIGNENNTKRAINFRASGTSSVLKNPRRPRLLVRMHRA